MANTKIRKIYQYSIPRSGSTLIYQILNCLYPDRVKKTHKYCNGKYIVGTYRNFADSLMSYWRIYNPNKILNRKIVLKRYFFDYKKHISTFQRMTNNNSNILWLEYEQFYNDFDYIFNHLEFYFDIEINEKTRIHIRSLFNIQQNKKISESLKGNFDDIYDKKTLIHSNHIRTGKPEGWKELLNPKLHNYLYELLRTV